MANANSALAALGDPVRRAIFERLSAAPAAVGALAETLPVTRSAVSQHLKVLKDANLVTETVVGTRHIYRLDPRGIAAMRDWLDAHWAGALDDIERFWKDPDKFVTVPALATPPGQPIGSDEQDADQDEFEIP